MEDRVAINGLFVNFLSLPGLSARPTSFGSKQAQRPGKSKGQGKSGCLARSNRKSIGHPRADLPTGRFLFPDGRSRIPKGPIPLDS